MREHPFRRADYRPICRDCGEEAQLACARCQAPLCAQHAHACRFCQAALCEAHTLRGPFPAGLWRGERCARCEGRLDRGYHRAALTFLLVLLGLWGVVAVAWVVALCL